MSQAIQTMTWRCRTCGGVNDMKRGVCPCGYRSSTPDQSKFLELLDRPRQVMNANANVVYNNVYNFARGQGGEVTVLTPQGQQERAPEPEAPAPPPDKQRYWTLTRICLRFVTVICTLTVGVVFGTFLLVIALAILKMGGH